MKKTVISALLILLSTLVLAGCASAGGNGSTQGAGDDSAAPADEQADDAKAQDAASQKQEPIELVWWSYSPTGEAPDAYEEVLKRANEISAEKIGVTVKMIYNKDKPAKNPAGQHI